MLNSFKKASESHLLPEIKPKPLWSQYSCDLSVLKKHRNLFVSGQSQLCTRHMILYEIQMSFRTVSKVRLKLVFTEWFFLNKKYALQLKERIVKISQTHVFLLAMSMGFLLYKYLSLKNQEWKYFPCFCSNMAHNLGSNYHSSHSSSTHVQNCSPLHLIYMHKIYLHERSWKDQDGFSTFI